eukprot:Nk52_evm23s2426 gene=Nk52_evmTU23s2426
MIPGLVPENESKRLEVLMSLQIMDTAMEDTYDRITTLASRICETPISLVSLVDQNRQWFKSRKGLDASQTPREYAFCGHAINQQSIFVVPNAMEDERFCDNPLVTGAPNVIFYAGFPLEVEEGVRVGTLCVIDNKAREGGLTALQKETLETLGHCVTAELKLLRRTLDMEKALKVKSVFLSSMSHEMRTPLNGIMGMTHVLMHKYEQDYPALAMPDLWEEDLSASYSRASSRGSINATKGNSEDTRSQRPHVALTKHSSFGANSDSGGPSSHKDGEGRVSGTVTENYHMLSVIEGCCNHMLTMINDVLDISKLEAGMVRLDRHVFDIWKLLERNCELLGANAEKRNVTIIFIRENEYEEGVRPAKSRDVPTFLYGDGTRISQIIINLLGNAIKFCRSGGEITLNVERLSEAEAFPHLIGSEIKKQLSKETSTESSDSIGREYRKTCYLKFSVRDQGIGIPDDVKPRLFKRFEQGDLKVYSKYGGTGLGLAICKELVASMNGSIWFESEVNVGTEFIFVIELAEIIPEGRPSVVIDDFIREEEEETVQEEEERKGESNSNMNTDSNISHGNKDCASGKSHSTLALISEDARLLNLDLKHVVSLPLEISTAKDHPLKILFCDDSRVNQIVFTQMISRLGYLVDVAGSGQETLSLISDCAKRCNPTSKTSKLTCKPYDLVVLDLNMPEMDGYETTEAILKVYAELTKQSEIGAHQPSPSYREAPIIYALTGDVSDECKESCKKAGMVGRITKPLSISQLQLVLGAAVYRKESVLGRGRSSILLVTGDTGTKTDDHKAYASNLQIVGGSKTKKDVSETCDHGTKNSSSSQSGVLSNYQASSSTSTGPHTASVKGSTSCTIL